MMKFLIALSTLIFLCSAAIIPKSTLSADIVSIEGVSDSNIGQIEVSLAAADTTIIAQRAITHVYICINSNFQPACTNLQVNTGVCYNLIGNWNDAVSSIGPDKGTTCTIWIDYGCSGRKIENIVNPGISNLKDWAFNDVASSVKCF